MTETRATAPVFPAGRYGRRRDGRRHLAAPVLLAVALLALTGWLAVRLYRQYGDPTYDAQVIRYTDITDTQVTVDFTVQVPPGGGASCLLQARAYDGSEVGRRTVVVTAAPGSRRATASEHLPTTAKPIIAEVVRCLPVH